MIDPRKAARQRVAYCFTQRQEALKLSNLQVARELGYTSTNVISMMRTADMLIPLDKVYQVAQLLKVDPAELMMDCIESRDALMLPAFKRCFGLLSLAPDERRFVMRLRRRRGLDT